MKLNNLSFPLLAAVLALAPMAHAQFGSGIVYDPTQSAHAIQEIQQGETQLQKWATELNNWQQHLLKDAQIYATAEHTRTQIVTMYNLAYQMATSLKTLSPGTRRTGRSGRTSPLRRTLTATHRRW